MKVAVFSTKPYDRRSLAKANEAHEMKLVYFESHLRPATVQLARGYDAVCAFVNDEVNAETLEGLAEGGIKVVALRCAGFNNVDLEAARELGIRVVRVPAYSPFAVAEHAAALVLALNRRLHRAHNRVREGNFALDGLLGFDLHGKTVGVLGTGRIGAIFCKIMQGFGCHVLAYDLRPDPDCTRCGVEYTSIADIYARSDIISLHCPLTPETYHIVNEDAVGTMKPGVMLINTSRGALVDTRALIDGLKSGRIGYVGLDVYEEEADLFFEDLSGQVIQDDVFARLMTFPNVLITGHQAFFTEEALTNIAETTLENIRACLTGDGCPNLVTSSRVRGGQGG